MSGDENDVAVSSYGNIQQIRCIPQTEQHEPEADQHCHFRLMLLCLGNVTSIYNNHLNARLTLGYPK